MKKKIKIILKGELVLSKLSNYSSSFLKVLDSNVDILLDLSEVVKIDAAGLQFLLAFFNSRVQRGKSLQFDFRKNEKVAELFHATGMEKIIYME